MSRLGHPSEGVSVGAGNDSTEYTGENVLMGLYVGTGGNVKVDFADGGTAVLYNLSNGAQVAYVISKVYSTDTTASNIVGLR